MRKLRYTIYLLTERLKRKLVTKTTRTGRYILILSSVSLIFGLNTYATMLYQMAGLLVAALIISFPFSLRFSPKLLITRNLPENCTAGDGVTYGITITNTTRKCITGIAFHESPPVKFPTFEEFSNTAETGEEERNIVDRFLKYYRWSWLVKKKHTVLTPTLALRNIPPEGTITMDASLTAQRRGLLHLHGYTLQRSDPFGIFKKCITIKDEKNILILPKTYPITDLLFTGSRKYHQGGLISGAQFGDSQEFVALREYQPGDSIRHIDWKATARTQKPILRQYQDEYYSRYGVILDGFTPLVFCPLFEEAISIAASIIMQNENSSHVVDLLFTGKNFVSSATMGKGLAEQQHLLEILACLTTSQEESYSELSKLVENHVHLLSGAILIFIDFDKDRQKLLTFLQNMGIPFQAILITHSQQQGQEMLEGVEQLPSITIVPLDRATKEVRLS